MKLKMMTLAAVCLATGHAGAQQPAPAAVTKSPRTDRAC